MRVLLFSSGVVISALLAACAESSSDEDERAPAQSEQARRAKACEAVRDHLVALRLDGVTGDVEQHRAALLDATGRRIVDDCVASYSDDAIACVRAADDAVTAQDCLAAR